MSGFDRNVQVSTIVAGKLRRYNHLTTMQQLMWPSLVLMNIRDSFLVLVGFIQSIFRLIFWRPDVIFIKGGYVCLPVGIAASLLRIPLVVHDSDAHPGLTNRILSKFAKLIATGAPLEYYSYPADKTRYVGIPISDEFHKFSKEEQHDAKKQWGINTRRPLIVITGGGLGATRINDTVALALDDLMMLGSIVLVSGAGQYDELRSITPPDDENFQLHAFISSDMASLLGAADLVVARAGATTILELAALEKPTILIPNGKLTGGHQLKNAAVYSENKAVSIVDEDEMIKNHQLLVSAIKDILLNANRAQEMSKSLASFARPNAARDVADMITSLC